MKIVHVITGLKCGGAEGTLARLVLAANGCADHVVVSLTGRGVWGEFLEARGIPVRYIKMTRTGANPLDWWRVVHALKAEKADIVQTWMYHSDLIGGLAARIAGVRAVAWGIRNLTLPKKISRATTRLVRRLCAWLSGWVPDAIVCCSEDAAELHKQIGYSGRKMTVIRNGIDTTRFRPDPAARERLRSQWGVERGTKIIGMVARWDPQKDHITLLRAIDLVRSAVPNVRCILVGPGIEESNENLCEPIRALGLSGIVSMLGPRDDIPEIMNALDLHVLSSRGEAFPNVVGEAMACGTPCVVTNVGDAAVIVGETGEVVSVGDSVALADAIVRRIYADASVVRAVECRQRIEQHFGLAAMVDSYCSFWTVLHARRKR